MKDKMHVIWTHHGADRPGLDLAYAVRSLPGKSMIFVLRAGGSSRAASACIPACNEVNFRAGFGPCRFLTDGFPIFSNAEIALSIALRSLRSLTRIVFTVIRAPSLAACNPYSILRTGFHRTQMFVPFSEMIDRRRSSEAFWAHEND